MCFNALRPLNVSLGKGNLPSLNLSCDVFLVELGETLQIRVPGEIAVSFMDARHAFKVIPSTMCCSPYR
jgi:hypothetical protein